jgi:predicted RNA-binding Zn-ribbon protein involved in translation (DUF1610 family)
MTETTKIYHKCSNCGYIVSDLQFRLSVLDFPCPRCNKTYLSSFEIMKND